MGTLKIYNGASWDTVIAKAYNGATWEDQLKFYDGADWIELYPTGGGDTITLNNASSSDVGEDGAEARLRCYNLGLNQGECWVEDGGLVYDHDVITPGANANDYQMKWVLDIGDSPTSASSATGVWYPLSSGDFYVEWFVDGDNETSGTVIVSIRKGTGDTLDTASWDGEAVSTKKGQ